MGGIGSGRRYQGGKETTSDMQALDIRRLQGDGLLTPGQAFGWHWTVNGKEVASIQMHTEVDRVILNYRSRSNEGDWQPMEYPVPLEWTNCNSGGRRAWFLCPARGCGRRVAILYGGVIFACRQCNRLVYPSQRESADDRALRKAQNIRKRLGGTANMTEPFPPKPKGMHWRTFEHLAWQHYVFYAVSIAGTAKKLGLKIEN